MTGSLQIKSDKYYAVLNFKDENGKRVQKWVPLNLPVRGNKRKAEVMLTELINEYQGMECVEPVNRLLSQHIALWIERDRPHIAVTTYNQYVNMLKLHIAPYFDPLGITVGSVTPGDLEDYYWDKVASGLSPNTVIKHHAVIRSSLQWALKHQYIRYNPADLADKPSRVKYQANEPYSVEEIVQLLTLTQNEPIAVPIFLASFYGLRRSELLGLRWSAIDFQNGWIHIETTVVKEKIGDRVVSTVREGTTKTESSRRSLPLCQYTYNYFSWLRQRQLTQMQLCGACYNREYLDFVCVDEMGMLLQPDFVSQKFQQILAKYGLRPIRFHDLRHPYVKHTTKIFSLRLMFFQAQPVPDALRKTRGVFPHLREGGSHNPFLQKMPSSLCRWAGVSSAWLLLRVHLLKSETVCRSRPFRLILI